MGLRLIDTAADLSATGTFMQRVLPDFDGQLYALYAWGSADRPRTELQDWTRNGRDLTKTGTPTLAASYASVSSTAYYTTPFTVAQLVAAGTANEATLIAIANAAGVFAPVLGSGTTGVNYLGLTRKYDGTFYESALDHTAGTLERAQIATAGAYAGLRIIGGAFDTAEAVVYRTWPAHGAAETAVDTGPAGTIAVGTNPFLIGGVLGATPQAIFGTNVGDVRMAAFYSKKLSAAEFEEVAAAAIDYFTEKGGW